MIIKQKVSSKNSLPLPKNRPKNEKKKINLLLIGRNFYDITDRVCSKSFNRF